MSEQERVNAGVQPATGAGEPTPIIFLDDIRVTFKTRTGSILHPNKVQAVRGLTLKLMPGETLGIVGESGCGKSTTANVMCGLQQPTSGKVFFKGEDVTKRSAAQRRLIGRVISVVFQDPATALNARMSVHDQLMDPLVVHKVGDKTSRERRVLDLIEMVGLPNSVLDALPGQLSGGQRQRVAMGRAIVRDPAVFLFDEPLSNLDAKLRVQMRLELQQLHRRLKTTSLYVTHDQVEAMTLAQRVMVMNKGVAEQIGTPVEVYEKPASRFVASFIGSPAMNLLEGRISDDGGRFELAGGMQLPTNHEHRRHAGRKMTLGIRPEHFILSSQAQGGIPLLMDTLEILGADNLAHGRWGEQKLVVRLPHQQRPAAGSTLWLHLPLEHLHLFDGETGQRA